MCVFPSACQERLFFFYGFYTALELVSKNVSRKTLEKLSATNSKV